MHETRGTQILDIKKRGKKLQRQTTEKENKMHSQQPKRMGGFLTDDGGKGPTFCIAREMPAEGPFWLTDAGAGLKVRIRIARDSFPH